MATSESTYKYTLRNFHTHENLGPASEELAMAYEAALQAGQRYVEINPHACPTKVYVEHGFNRSNVGSTHS